MRSYWRMFAATCDSVLLLGSVVAWKLVASLCSILTSTFVLLPSILLFSAVTSSLPAYHNVQNVSLVCKFKNGTLVTPYDPPSSLVLPMLAFQVSRLLSA